MHTGIVPDYFGGGVLTPVPKSGKDPTVLDNYRGNTVTPVISPTMSSLICTEVINESRIERKPLYLLTIDYQKSLCCVNHVILKIHCLRKVWHLISGLL